MCKSIVSVDWQGFLYDCDFNQQLGINIDSNVKTIHDILNKQVDWYGKPISVGKHCYGCTAGSGSSCGGSLT